MSAGKSLELFFIDGRPDGMLTAKVFNWTGHVLRVPRLQIIEGLRRPETAETGVYLLIDEESEKPKIYIGETEDLRERLRKHVLEKEWWKTAVLITNAGEMLHKAHVKYLESRLVEIARDVSRASLENGNTPPRSRLSEAHQVNMEAFLETLLMVLPAIRIDYFLNKKSRKEDIGYPSGAKPGPVFEFKMARLGISAQAQLRNDEWVLLSGSTVRVEWIGDRKHVTSYVALYEELVSNGTIAIENETARLTTDFALASPSAAASIVAGTARNGRIDWKHISTGQTYAEWEAAQLEQESP